MRRQGNLGRTKTLNEQKKSVQVLAAARLHRCPGLMTVLAAMRQFRMACSCGDIKVSPRDCFSDLGWLQQ
eukprot:Skav220706  [mRNA]  locus=scaffold472:988386:988595:- [translate_table: standard]